MRTFGRVRLDADEALLLKEVLKEAIYKRVGEKVLARQNGDDTALDARRWELRQLNRMVEETDRVLEDLNGDDGNSHSSIH